MSLEVDSVETPDQVQFLPQHSMRRAMSLGLDTHAHLDQAPIFLKSPTLIDKSSDPVPHGMSGRLLRLDPEGPDLAYDVSVACSS